MPNLTEKVRKPFHLLSRVYSIRNVMVVGKAKKRKLLADSQLLLREEIKDLPEDAPLAKALESVSIAIDTWSNQLDEADEDKMIRLIQKENANWAKASKIMENLGESDVRYTIDGWQHQSEAEVHRRSLFIKEACASWQKAASSFLKAKEMSLAADMYFNAAVYQDRTLGRPAEAIQVLTEGAEGFLGLEEYSLAGELTRYAGTICFDLRGFDEARTFYRRAAGLYRRGRNVPQVIYMGLYIFRVWSLEAIYVVYRRAFRRPARRVIEQDKAASKSPSFRSAYSPGILQL